MFKPWVLLSLLSAFCLATSDALTKRVITRENEYVIAWLRLVAALPALWAALWLAGPLPSPDAAFYGAFFAALPLEIGAILLYYRALRLSPISLTLPFLAASPVFLILFSFLIAGEAVSFAGGLGIALIGIGGYALNLSSLRTGILEPLRAILRERGSVYMLIVALLYSVTSALGKVGVDHSSPAFFGATYVLAVVLVLIPVIVIRSGVRNVPSLIRRNLGTAALPALFDAVASVSYFYALSMANVAYAIAVKRTSLLIGSVYGFLLFRERNVRDRLVGAMLLLAGFGVIALFR